MTPDIQQDRPHNPPAINLPPATLWLLIAILVCHLVRIFSPEPIPTNAFWVFGFIPDRFTEIPFTTGGALPLLTYQLVHADWLHLAINMAAIAAFGSGVERAIGIVRMTVLAIGAGVAGGLAQWAWAMESMAPVIGASGLASGLFGAVIVMLRRSGPPGIVNNQSLLLILGIWIGVSALFGEIGGAPGAPGPIAWVAHVGGLLFGAAAFALLDQPHRRMDS